MASRESEAARIFLEAVEHREPHQWTDYVQAAAAGDPALVERVEALLRAHGQPNPMLDENRLMPTAALPRADAMPGTAIGPYKLLEQIGEGGFGVVYMAEQQQPVRRKVALKVLKPGIDTRQVVARFEAERQALALMDHPHIAHVLDAGATDAGRPYFVMELIRGIPITQFCDDNQLTPRKRLELFITVCQAVQHAHQKGIIHRDLKPSNVLVTLHDGNPLVKVIDFGIAKALGQERLTEKTLCTGFAQMIGTPLYMSPEQADMSGQDADTRTDIYSLGVLLYELLTGTTPFDKDRLKEASFDEIRRIVREEEPAKPSTRISTLGQAATTVSANRQSEPRRLSQLLRGELDWIVMKALEKDRNRRYESASAFVADVQRYLHDEPVQACPPSAAYRLRKFARRNRRMVVLTGFGGVAILALAVAGFALFYNAKLQESFEETDQARQTATAALEEAQFHQYFHFLARANAGWQSENMGQVEKLLDACVAERRGWEWHYLKALCHAELLTLRGHHGIVEGVAFSPDGTWLASCAGDGVRIWDATTGQAIRTLAAHDGITWGLAISRDGTRLATAGEAGSVKVWDAMTWQCITTCKDATGRAHNNGYAWGVAFSPDGSRLASRGSDSNVKIWDATTGRPIQTFVGHTNKVVGIAYSPDATRIASAGYEGMVIVWDAHTGKPLHRIPGITNQAMLTFSPDGTLLAVAAASGAVRFGLCGPVRICLRSRVTKAVCAACVLVRTERGSPRGARMA